MKTILALSILFCAIALPSLGELTDADLNQIRLIVKEEVKTESLNIDGKIDDIFNSWEKRIDDKFNSFEKRFDSIEKNFDRQNTLIIACIAIPMALITILIAWRSVKDNSQEKINQELREEIEMLKQQQIVRP